MVANAAFSIGLAVGLADEIWEYIPTMPYNYAEYNFYRAAQNGLDAKILWPFSNIHHPEQVAIVAIDEHSGSLDGARTETEFHILKI